MKTSTIVMIAAAAALTIGCSPKKSVEEKLAELNAWNAAFGEFAMNRLMQLEDSPEAQQEFLDSASAAYLEYNMAALNENLDNEVLQNEQLREAIAIDEDDKKNLTDFTVAGISDYYFKDKQEPIE